MARSVRACCRVASARGRRSWRGPPPRRAEHQFEHQDAPGLRSGQNLCQSSSHPVIATAGQRAAAGNPRSCWIVSGSPPGRSGCVPVLDWYWPARAGLAVGLPLAQHVPARVAIQIVRHSQIALTLNTYSHVTPAEYRSGTGLRASAVTAKSCSGDLVAGYSYRAYAHLYF